MKITTFRNVAHKFVKAVGRDRKISLSFGGSEAMTDGKHINLPSLPPGTILTTYEADVFRGYMDHEVGHVRETDFDVVKKDVPKFEKNPGFKHLSNLVEDIREETAYLGRYPGARSYLDTLCHFIDQRGLESLAKQPAPRTFAETALALVYRELWHHRDVKADVGCDLSLEDLGLQEVQNLLDVETPKLKTTRQAHTLAWKIYDLLDEAVDEFTPPPQKGDGDPKGGPQKSAGQPGQPGQGGQPGDGDPGDGDPGESGQPGDGQPQAGGSKGGSGGPNGDRTRQPTEAGDLDGAGEASEWQTGDVLDKLLDQIRQSNGKLEKGSKGKGSKGKGSKGKGPGSRPSRPQAARGKRDPQGHRTDFEWSGDTFCAPASTDSDRIFVPSRENLARYASIRSRFSGEITSTKKALSLLLRSRMAKAWSRGLEHGSHLDRQRVPHFMATGNTRIRKERRDRTMVNSAIAVALDLSASMSELDVQHAGICLTEALSMVPKAKTFIYGFTTNSARYTPTPNCGRTEGLDLSLFKSWDSTIQECFGRLGALQTTAHTPLGEGYAYGFDELVTRPEPRKVLIIVTDGDPYYQYGDRPSYASVGGSSHNDFALLAAVREKARRMGVITVGLALAPHHDDEPKVNEFVDYPHRISGGEDLSEALLKIAREVLVP